MHAWNAFAAVDTDPGSQITVDYGPSSSQRLDRSRYRMGNERSIINSIYTRIAIDVAAETIQHVRLDDKQNFSNVIMSGLNYCLTQEANIDQGARMFKQDIVQTLFDRGVAAIVPIDTTLDPETTGGYDINTMRVGHVLAWYPRHVKVSVYDDRPVVGGTRREVILPKDYVAIIENPLYNVMNEPNSTLRRLIRKLNLLDAVDEQSASGNLDIIIQLPYAIKSESRQKQAEERRTQIETQLRGSKYGIAYTDGTEKITQLNRPAENNLMAQVTYLTNQLYSELGLTPEIMDGSANEQAMLNYYNRTVEPIIAAITEALKRTFLTRTARTQLQSIESYRNPFKFVTLADLANLADKFTRNEIASSNEIRAVVGWKPSSDPNADKLLNKNIPAPPGSGIGQPVMSLTRPGAVQEATGGKPNPAPVGPSKALAALPAKAVIPSKGR
jgi:hypothetical protein